MHTKINNNTYKPDFKACHIANTKNIYRNIETEIKLYELSNKSDRHFLNTFDIDMETLMPGLAKYDYERWHDMLEVAKDNALKPDRKSYLAVTDNKPCGLVAFLPGKKDFFLDCICTWPVEYAQKVNFAGSTLFNQVFRIFNKNNANKIKLEAITNGPFDTVRKYQKLGFIPITSYGHKVAMETNTQRVKQQLNILDDIIEYQQINTKKHENINLILNI